MDQREPPPSASVTEMPQARTQRLWVEAKDGNRSVNGYIEPSGTGMSIRYDLKIEGPVYSITVVPRGRHTDIVGQSAAALHGESLRTRYLDVPQAPDAVSSLFKRPRLFRLVVSFDHGDGLSAGFSRRPNSD